MNRPVPNGMLWWCERTGNKLIISLLLDPKKELVNFFENYVDKQKQVIYNHKQQQTKTNKHKKS